MGAILAGGKSSRFGSDKAAFEVNGRPLLDHVAAALRPHVETVIIVGRAWPGNVTVEDRPAAGLGPLGGLCGALLHAHDYGFDGVLSAGCDALPVPAERVLGIERPVVLSCQPLIGWWPASFASPLAEWLADTANRSVYRWVEVSKALRVEAPQRVHNLNTAEDLERWQSDGAPGT